MDYNIVQIQIHCFFINSLADLSIVENKVLKSPNVILLLFISPFLNKFIYFIYLFLAVGSSLLCAGSLQLWQAGATHCGVQASHCGGLPHCGTRALGVWASVVVAHGLIFSMACGIFPDQVSNPCPLHWQADSQPLRHQGSPNFSF